MVATAAFVAAAMLLLRQESWDGRYPDSGSAGPLGMQNHGAAVRGGVQFVKVPSRPLVTLVWWPSRDLLAASECSEHVVSRRKSG